MHSQVAYIDRHSNSAFNWRWWMGILRRLHFNIVITGVLSIGCWRPRVYAWGLDLRGLPWGAYHLLIWSFTSTRFFFFRRFLLNLGLDNFGYLVSNRCITDTLNNWILLAFERYLSKTLLFHLIGLVDVWLEIDFVIILEMIFKVFWHFWIVSFQRLACQLDIESYEWALAIAWSCHEYWWTHPGHIVNWVIVNAFQHSNRHDALSVVQQNVIAGWNGEHHSVR